MARKTLLSESEIRQFMKLANIQPLQEMGGELPVPGMRDMRDEDEDEPGMRDMREEEKDEDPPGMRDMREEEEDEDPPGMRDMREEEEEMEMDAEMDAPAPEGDMEMDMGMEVGMNIVTVLIRAVLALGVRRRAPLPHERGSGSLLPLTQLADLRQTRETPPRAGLASAVQRRAAARGQIASGKMESGAMPGSPLTADGDEDAVERSRFLFRAAALAAL